MDFKHLYEKYKQKYIQLKNKLSMKQTGGKQTNTLYLFKAEWCPHCVGFKPTWTKIQDELKDNINFVTYDADEHKNEIEKYKIDGFPTLILKLHDKAVEYVGNRDEKSIKEFIKEYTK